MFYERHVCLNFLRSMKICEKLTYLRKVPLVADCVRLLDMPIIIGNLLLFRMVHCVSLLLLLLLLLLLFCLHPFWGLNAFLISGIKPLLHTLVLKYVKGKGLTADSVCGLTTWSRGLLLPLLVSQQTYLLWLCLDLQTSGL